MTHNQPDEELRDLPLPLSIWDPAEFHFDAEAWLIKSQCLPRAEFRSELDKLNSEELVMVKKVSDAAEAWVNWWMHIPGSQTQAEWDKLSEEKIALVSRLMPAEYVACCRENSQKFKAAKRRGERLSNAITGVIMLAIGLLMAWYEWHSSDVAPMELVFVMAISAVIIIRALFVICEDPDKPEQKEINWGKWN